MRTRRLILASASPRRAYLLKSLRLPFEVLPSGASEILDPPLPPADHVVEISRRKVDAIRGRVSNAILLGADTVVVHRNRILEKPGDTHQAVDMLRSLSGETHTVLTGVALGADLDGPVLTDVAATQVTFRSLTAEDIHRYVDTGDPLDKAGAYAAQGLAATFIECISGCFYNVVGLPLTCVWQLYHRLTGESLWSRVDPDAPPSDLLSG